MRSILTTLSLAAAVAIPAAAQTPQDPQAKPAAHAHQGVQTPDSQHKAMAATPAPQSKTPAVKATTASETTKAVTHAKRHHRKHAHAKDSTSTK